MRHREGEMKERETGSESYGRYNDDVEMNSNNIKSLQQALNHANFSNIRAEDYVNIDMEVATEADLNDINLFTDDHQQAEEQDQELQLEEEESLITELSVKTYNDALKHLKDLENFALTHKILICLKRLVEQG
jgi:hypothetical protein